MHRDTLIDAIAQAIARFEGYFVSSSRARRNNNPGNLRRWGDRPVDGGFALFDTPEDGWAALRRQIEINIARGLNLREFFAGKPGVYPGYAPAADSNDPAAYARFVSERAGVPEDIPLVVAGQERTPFPWPAIAEGEDSSLLLLAAGALLAAAALI